MPRTSSPHIHRPKFVGFATLSAVYVSSGKEQFHGILDLGDLLDLYLQL